MHHIIYISRARKNLSPLELVTLLIESRGGNERQHITGALVYGGGRFMQIIEGEEEVVKKLYARIEQDPRHYEVCKLGDKPVTRRLFAHWTMAFDEVSADQFQELLGHTSREELVQELAGTRAEDGLLLRLREIVCV
jgi:hypothetical protein